MTPETRGHSSHWSRFTDGYAQNIFRSTETNESHTNHSGTPVLPNAFTTENEHSDISGGTAELKTSTKSISGEARSDLENKTNETEISLATHNEADDITAVSSATSNYSHKTSRIINTNDDHSTTTTGETASHYWSIIITKNTTDYTEIDGTTDSYDLNSTSAHEPGAGNVSAVADDDSVISPGISTTSVTTESSGCSDSCNGQDQYGHSWTGCPGSYVSRSCPNRASGEAKWFCDSYGNNFVGETPDYSNCTHLWIEEVQKEVSNLSVHSGIPNM
jgi:hypothetical protein